MRYFTVTYIQKPKNRRSPDGGYDESAEVTRRLRDKDISMASVILDFRDMQVVKCTVSGQIGSRDWDTVHNYYLQHYQHIFERLHEENGRKIMIDQPATDTTPVDA
jgi:predicted dehydrogenase